MNISLKLKRNNDIAMLKNDENLYFYNQHTTNPLDENEFEERQRNQMMKYGDGKKIMHL